MRKALIVGIDHYNHLRDLSGCVNDATAVHAVLARHADGTGNFVTPLILTARDAGEAISRHELKAAVRKLFADAAEIALFYFAGHGHLEDTGGFLCASDATYGDDGLALSEVMTWANTSPARNKIIVLDSCHSGVTGNNAISKEVAEVSDGVTILTASSANQYAMEAPGGGSGIFTNLFVDALNGGAANLTGDVTPGSVYAHIDQSLGTWAQRPVFKTNVKRFVSLRRTEPPIALAELQALIRHFPAPDHELRLDPSFEPERSAAERLDRSIPPPDPANTLTFQVLQNYARVNLLRPVGAPHMWHAAMQSRSCRLTPLGQHYWRLVDGGLI
jgi:caspase domain-containing protein